MGKDENVNQNQNQHNVTSQSIHAGSNGQQVFLMCDVYPGERNEPDVTSMTCILYQGRIVDVNCIHCDKGNAHKCESPHKKRDKCYLLSPKYTTKCVTA